ncbi:MAG TPA: YihA family ribosome biogenesis GTP-binding protein [Deltaproteobacteria bacterium]|nr:YihA family ribosome biogenesis GTP-binding protein [Deltaproteobacteria bacterium]
MIVKIKDARYVGTMYDQLPELPQFAFAGRSNVGKSSLINLVLGRKALVRTSKQPGKTRNINFFQVDLLDLPSIHMVDLPGYGYAKVCAEMKSSWGGLASKYFHNNASLKLIILLVDIRRDLKEEEFMVLDLAKDSRCQSLLVITKADKLSRNKQRQRIDAITRQYDHEPVLSSALSREGIDPIWRAILAQIPRGPRT